MLCSLIPLTSRKKKKICLGHFQIQLLITDFCPRQLFFMQYIPHWSCCSVCFITVPFCQALCLLHCIINYAFSHMELYLWIKYPLMVGNSHFIVTCNGIHTPSSETCSPGHCAR